MKRALCGYILCFVAVAGFAQTKTVELEKPFRPANPVVVGQGGSFTANGYGFNSFFNNPASLAGKGSFTLLSVNPWLYSTGEMMQFVMDQASGPSGEAKDLPAGWVPVEIDLGEGFVLPEGYETEQEFEDFISPFLNEVLAELDPGQEIVKGATLTIPASLAELAEMDLDAIDTTDITAFEDILVDFMDANEEIAARLSEKYVGEILPEGFPAAPKLRVGMAAGAGLIIGGFGLGVAGILDVEVKGSSIFTTQGQASFTVGFMGGFAHEFKLSDSLGLSVGGLLRPMFRVNAPVKLSSVMGAFGEDGFDVDSLIDTLLARYGTGIGIDVGAILRLGPLAAGLSITDLFGTAFNYKQSPLRTLYESLQGGQGLPDGDPIEDTRYVVPMDMRLGASFHPNLGALSFLIDPTVHLEIGNFIPVARARALAREQGRTLPKFRIGQIAEFGAEVRVLRIAAIRAGYYQGAVSAGLGLHLLFLDANVAAYIAPKEGEKLEGQSGWGDLGDIGFTAELAVRF